MEQKRFCDYGCGRVARFQMKSGKWCCSENFSSCPQVRRKNSEKQKERVANGNWGFTQWNKLRKQGKILTWNKGLTKESDKRVKERANKLKQRYKNGELIPSFKGKHWSDEQRKRISEQRKKYLNEHPDKVPYLLNHSSKISYPERYFKWVFFNEQIDLKYHLQVGRYQLDFYNLEQKKYVEIDGEHHYLDPKTVKIDKERTEFLKGLGWQSLRIRWKDYKKLSLNERKNTIFEIKKFILPKH